MDFTFDDDHRMLQQQIREFALREVAKGAAARDEAATMPEELLQQLRELGLFGIAIPDEFGGANMGTVASTIVVEHVLDVFTVLGILVLVVLPEVQMLEPVDKEEPVEKVAPEEPLVLMVVQEIKEILVIPDHLEM